MERKLREYFLAGVRLVWIIDPEERSVTVYTPDNGPRSFADDEELTGGEGM